MQLLADAESKIPIECKQLSTPIISMRSGPEIMAKNMAKVPELHKASAKQTGIIHAEDNFILDLLNHGLSPICRRSKQGIRYSFSFEN
jgi:hypothetical protein